MRILRVRLHGYKGIYSGMNGLKTLNIDLSNNVNKIIMIKGDNGSGKSTLFNALHMYPDSLSGLMDENCYKELLYREGNSLYHIRIEYPYHNGKRQTTKAYISKSDINSPGSKTELNQNGNVTSYCNKIEELFKIDKDFMSLSHLGVEDRGLVDKTPSERKKFISNIISDLDIYKDIYKIANVKLSGQGDRIRTLSQTLDKLSGGKPLIEVQQEVEKGYNELTSQKVDILSKLDNINKRIESSPIDNIDVIEETNKKLDNEQVELTNKQYKLNKIRKSINMLFVPSDDHINEAIRITESELSKLDRELDKLDKLLYKKTVDFDAIRKEMSDISERLSILKDSDESSEYISIIDNLNDKLSTIQTEIDKLGVIDYRSFSTDMYLVAMNALDECQTVFNTIQSMSDYATLQKAVNLFNNNDIIDIVDLTNKLETCASQYDEIMKTLAADMDIRDSLDTLKNRPKECKIDSCKFISEYVKVDRVELDARIDKNTKLSKDLSEKIDKYDKDIDEASDINQIIANLHKFVKIIKANGRLLSKLKIKSDLYHEKKFITALLSGYVFNEYDQLSKHISKSNLIDENNDLISKIEVNKDKLKLFEDSRREIINLENRLGILKAEHDKINIIISKIKSSVTDYKKTRELNHVLLNTLNEYRDNMYELYDIQHEVNILQAELDKLISSNKELHDLVENRKTLKVDLIKVEEDLKAKDIERQEVFHKIKTYESYNQQLDELKGKYNKIDIIKKSSSVSTGIPVIYMSAYMSRILSKANMLLKYLFNGEFTLDNFIINDKEFSIPCIGSNLRHDDISTMSTSQKCMMSLVVSFAILSEVSPVYNIIKLDEIDGGLDNINRGLFVNTLYKLIDLLNAEQVFIISHNNEMNIDECDTIILRTQQMYDAKNVLYNFNAIN